MDLRFFLGWSSQLLLSEGCESELTGGVHELLPLMLVLVLAVADDTGCSGCSLVEAPSLALLAASAILRTRDTLFTSCRVRLW